MTKNLFLKRNQSSGSSLSHFPGSVLPLLPQWIESSDHKKINLPPLKKKSRIKRFYKEIILNLKNVESNVYSALRIFLARKQESELDILNRAIIFNIVFSPPAPPPSVYV